MKIRIWWQEKQEIQTYRANLISITVLMIINIIKVQLHQEKLEDSVLLNKLNNLPITIRWIREKVSKKFSKANLVFQQNNLKENLKKSNKIGKGVEINFELINIYFWHHQQILIHLLYIWLIKNIVQFNEKSIRTHIIFYAVDF